MAAYAHHGIFFGLFQAIMPLLGWLGASTFSHLIESVDHWIAFAILAFLGGRMIKESFKEEDCCQRFNPASLKVVITMAVATSIDALAVGVSFAFLGIKAVRLSFTRQESSDLFLFYVPYRINLRHSLRMRHCQKTSC